MVPMVLCSFAAGSDDLLIGYDLQIMFWCGVVCGVVRGACCVVNICVFCALVSF
jgi:hypothetical protein